MGRLLAVVVAVGLLAGFMWPGAKSPARTPVAAAVGGKHEVVLTRGSTGHFFTDANINGKGSVEFIVDTGASIVALTIEDARRLGVDVDPAKFEVVGEGAGGAVRGQDVVLDSVEVEGIKVEHVRAVVLADSNISLLGQTFLANVDHVDMSGDYLTLRDEG
ncbi:MAG: TIGR02281 family clan AA aspartic protease [Sphingomicrobium sp.]